MAQQTIQIEQLVDDQKIRWFNINLLLWSWLAMFADGFDISALSFASTELVREWGVPRGDFGVPFAASNFGVLFGAPLLGYIGALIAIPVTASILLIIKQVFYKKQDAKI